MNSIVKVDNNIDHNLLEFNYLNDQETRGCLDNYSVYHGDSSISEFDPLYDPLFEPWLLPVQHDTIPELSLKDIEEITRDLDANHLSSFSQGNNTLFDATQKMTTAQSEFSHEQNILVDAKTTTSQSHYFHKQIIFVDAKPVYATTTHHEPQYLQQTHYGRPVYEMTTDQPQDFRNHYVDNFGNHENAVQNSMNLMDGYSDFPLQPYENNFVDAKPICMIQSTNHIQQCFNGPAANEFGNVVKNEMNLEMDQSSSSTSIVKYEEGVVVRQRCRTSALEIDEIRKYFDLPITKAAKELNVGLTVLKKRCRELNIMRWPHRKIKSLQSLIDNVKEMGMTNKEEIEMLEEHKRMLGIVPELELSESTKRLRQSCFKANYKKRRLLLSSATAQRTLTYH